MDIDAFWTLIQHTKHHEGPRPERLAFLRQQLTASPSSDIVQFQAHLDRACDLAYTWDLWGAAMRIFGGWCSDDGCEYFRNWLISLGRDVFERAVKNPDSLADVPEIRQLIGRHSREWTNEEWPEWEVLDYVAGEAYAEVEGIEDDCGDALYDAVEQLLQQGEPFLRHPAGDRWDARDEAASAIKLPKLTGLFPLTSPPRSRLGLPPDPTSR